MIDAHAHLTDPRIAAEVDDVIRRALEAGVTRIVTCGEDVPSSEAAVALARRYDSVVAAVGIHPHRAHAASPSALARIMDLAADPRVVAIGEIGVDLSGRSAPLDHQRRAFVAQLQMARDLGLPACVHVRDAGEEARSLVDRVPGVRGWIHCFSEGPAEVGEWTRRGFHVSFAGTVTYPGSGRLREAARATADDRVLIETDTPYLAPQARRGQRNEPAHVVHTYDGVARERGTTAAQLAEQVRANAAALFGHRW